MSRILLVSLLLVAALPVAVLAEGPQAQKEWTICVFINADNNLSSAGADDVTEMEKVGSTDKVNVVALLDQSGSNDTKVYFIEKKPASGIQSPIILNPGELDTGDWNEAFKFFKLCVDNYPAKRYMFALWNHGAGWEKYAPENQIKGICFDDTSGNHMKTTDLRKLTKAMHDYIGRKVDVISYDACLMQMGEVAHEVKDYCLVQVAAEETEPGDGWPYDDFLAPLVANPTMDAKGLGTKMVDAYVASYNGGSQGSQSTCQSAVDLTKMDAFMGKLNAFADALIANAEHNGTFIDVMGQTQAYYYSQYKDLGDFIKKVLPKTNVPEIKATGKALLDFYTSEFVVKSGYSGSSLTGTTGLSVYMPRKSQFDSMKAEYAKLTWSAVGKWDEFLQGLFYPNVPVISIKEIDYESASGSVNPGAVLSLKVKIANDGTQPSSALTVSAGSDSPYVSILGQSVAVDTVPGMAEILAPELKVQIAENCPVDSELTITAKAVDAAGKTFTKDIKVLVKKPFVVSANVLLIALAKTDEFTKFYAKALEDAGIAYDLWPLDYYGPASVALMKNYVNGAVIFNAPGTSEIEKVKLDDFAAYLDKGGSLFITGQDVGYKIKDLPFYKNYLHAKYVQDNTGITELAGQGILAGTAAKIAGGDGANNQKWPDEIDAIAPAQLVFKYKGAAGNVETGDYNGRTDTTRGINGSGGAGLAVSTGTFKVVYFAFGFEALESAALRKTVMAAVMAFLKPTAQDRIAGLSNLTRRNAGLEASNSGVAYDSARASEAQFIDRSAELVRDTDLPGLREEAKKNRLARDLLRKASFEQLAR